MRTHVVCLLSVIAAACGDVEPPDNAVDAGPDGGDAVEPETTIDEAPDEISGDGTATFRFSSDVDDATFECRVDDGEYEACTSPSSLRLDDGPHTFAVRAIDAEGLVDATPAEHAWTIDTAAPETTITAAPPPLDNGTQFAFEFESDDVEATFECARDGGGFDACASPHVVTNLGKGSHTFQVRAVDAAGNVDASPADHSWQVDTSTPDTWIDSGPSGAVAATSATFTFSSPDGGTGATFECALDGGGFATCASPRVLNGLIEGAHLFEVRVRDTGGVDPTPASRTWTVDVTAPDTTIASGPSGAVASTTATFALTANEAATFQCSLDGAAFAACTASYQATGLAQGAHTVQFRAVDLAGNVDATAALRSWTVDTVAPDTTLVSGPPALTASTSATFDVSSNESGVGFQCSQDGGAYAACSDPHTITVANGAHTRLIRAVDAAGNVDATPAARSWTVDTVAPTIQITSGPNQGSTTGPYSLWIFNVNDGSPLTCRMDSGSFQPCTSGLEYNLPNGSHTFTIQSIDAVGNVGQASRTWTVSCEPLPNSSQGWAVFHFEEVSGQAVSNGLQSNLPGVLGDSSAVETDDPAWVAAGRFGRGLRYNYVERDLMHWASNLTYNSHTFETWVNLTDSAVGAGGSTLFASEDGRIRVWLEDVGTQFQVRYTLTSSSGTVTTIQAAAASYGAWHHVLAQFSSNAMQLWVDGVQVTGTASISDAFHIGNAEIGTAADPIAGTLDEVYVGLSPLSRAQILGRYCPL